MSLAITGPPPREVELALLRTLESHHYVIGCIPKLTAPWGAVRKSLYGSELGRRDNCATPKSLYRRAPFVDGAGDLAAVLKHAQCRVFAKPT